MSRSQFPSWSCDQFGFWSPTRRSLPFAARDSEALQPRSPTRPGVPPREWHAAQSRRVADCVKGNLRDASGANTACASAPGRDADGFPGRARKWISVGGARDAESRAANGRARVRRSRVPRREWKWKGEGGSPSPRWSAGPGRLTPACERPACVSSVKK